MSHLVRSSLFLLAVAALACGDRGGPIDPTPGDDRRLAGGGRTSADDPFGGDEGSTGPPGPGLEPIADYLPLFFSDLNCFSGAFQRVIRTREEWEAWWNAAIACSPRAELIAAPLPPGIDPLPPGQGGGGTGGGVEGEGGGTGGGGVIEPDTGSVDPGFPGYPYVPELPEVDFSGYVVVAIGLEEEAGWGRGLWVKEVNGTAAGSTVRYEVSRPDEDCLFFLQGAGAVRRSAVLHRPGFLQGSVGPDVPLPIDPPLPSASSPVIAVLIPAPLGEPVTFVREDVTWSCKWEPDPALPFTLYYTETDCDLGAGEEIISDAAAWQTWLDDAVACDVARWSSQDDPTVIGGSGDTPDAPPPVVGPGIPTEPIPLPPEDGGGTGPDPALPPIGWLGADVDFTTHAVLVLRANSQIRWGGGIWLNSFDVTGNGTVLDYSVMEPSGECPLVETGEFVRPTAAIRLPLPLPAPIRYVRRVETIDCNWEPLPLLPEGPR